MASDGNVPRATELVYAPAPSWLPALMALGIALFVMGLYSEYLFPGWVYSVIGALLFLATLVAWAGDTEDEVSRMPVEQRTVTAVLPPQRAEQTER